MTYDYEKLSEIQLKLEEYCEYEQDEHGEFIQGLCHLASYSYCMGEEFLNALTKQMEVELRIYEEHCTLVKKTETQTHEWTELEWDN